MSLTTTPIVTSAVAAASFVRASFVGVTGPGVISVPDLVVGDVIIWLSYGSSAPLNVRYDEISTFFEAEVSVDDELQQTVAEDLSAVTINIICLRGV